MYAIYTKSTDPFTDAWSKKQWGIDTFQKALLTAAAMERRINHPPHALKIVQSINKNDVGGKIVMEWSRFDAREMADWQAEASYSGEKKL